MLTSVPPSRSPSAPPGAGTATNFALLLRACHRRRLSLFSRARDAVRLRPHPAQSAAQGRVARRGPGLASGPAATATALTARTHPTSVIGSRRHDLHVSPQNRRKVPRRPPFAQRMSSRPSSACSTRRQRRTRLAALSDRWRERLCRWESAGRSAGVSTPNDSTVDHPPERAVRDFPEASRDAGRCNRPRFSSGKLRRASYRHWPWKFVEWKHDDYLKFAREHRVLRGAAEGGQSDGAHHSRAEHGSSRIRKR